MIHYNEYMKTILLVEDEDMLRGLIRQILEIKGYFVLEAGNGVEALDILEASEVKMDLILTDVVMPQMNGTELVETLLPQFPNVKVIFMSGFTGASNATIHEYLERPGFAFLQKPFRLNVLTQQVKDLLEV